MESSRPTEMFSEPSGGSQRRFLLTARTLTPCMCSWGRILTWQKKRKARDWSVKYLGTMPSFWWTLMGKFWISIHHRLSPLHLFLRLKNTALFEHRNHFSGSLKCVNLIKVNPQTNSSSFKFDTVVLKWNSFPKNDWVWVEFLLIQQNKYQKKFELLFYIDIWYFKKI